MLNQTNPDVLVTQYNLDSARLYSEFLTGAGVGGDAGGDADRRLLLRQDAGVAGLDQAGLVHQPWVGAAREGRPLL